MTPESFANLEPGILITFDNGSNGSVWLITGVRNYNPMFTSHYGCEKYYELMLVKPGLISKQEVGDIGEARVPVNWTVCNDS